MTCLDVAWIWNNVNSWFHQHQKEIMLEAPEAQLHRQPKLHPWIPESLYDDTTGILNVFLNDIKYKDEHFIDRFHLSKHRKCL